MWRFIFAVPLLMHGLAHISGFLASWTSIDLGYASKPWVFSQSIHLYSLTGRVFGLLWLVAMLGLVVSAFGLVFRQDWWLPLAVAASVISLVVILPWWNTVPSGAKFGAFFDLLVIAALLSPLQGKLLQLAY
jgi:hypothetical protein